MRTTDFEWRKLAADTGGRAFFPTTLAELAPIYKNVAHELANQYSLGYYSAERIPRERFAD